MGRDGYKGLVYSPECTLLLEFIKQVNRLSSSQSLCFMPSCSSVVTPLERLSAIFASSLCIFEGREGKLFFTTVYSVIYLIKSWLQTGLPASTRTTSEQSCSLLVAQSLRRQAHLFSQKTRAKFSHWSEQAFAPGWWSLQGPWSWFWFRNKGSVGCPCAQPIPASRALGITSRWPSTAARASTALTGGCSGLPASLD